MYGAYHQTPNGKCVRVTRRRSSIEKESCQECSSSGFRLPGTTTDDHLAEDTAKKSPSSRRAMPVCSRHAATKVEVPGMSPARSVEERAGDTVWDVLCRAEAATMLGATAPCRGWLKAQQSRCGPEVFDAFFGRQIDVRERRDFVECAALLSLATKFFKDRPRLTRVEGRGLFALLEGDDPDVDRRENVYLVIDRRKGTTTVPPNARHVLVQYGHELRRNWPLYDGRVSDPFLNVRLETVWLPAVDTIHDNALAYCVALTTVAAPIAQSVNANAFRHCRALKTASFPMAFKIGAEAFRECCHVREAALPVCQDIGQAAFRECFRLVKFTAPAARVAREEAFYGARALTAASLPRAAEIGGLAFAENIALETVDAPVCEDIGASAFEHNIRLRSIVAISAVDVGHRAFRGCSALGTVVLPNVATIGVECFAGCTALGKVAATAGLVGDRAFRGCYRLRHLALPYAEVLCDETCRDCVKLEHVHSPRVHTVGAKSFFNCTKLLDQAAAVTPEAKDVGPAAFATQDSCPEILDDSDFEHERNIDTRRFFDEPVEHPPIDWWLDSPPAAEKAGLSPRHTTSNIVSP